MPRAGVRPIAAASLAVGASAMRCWTSGRAGNLPDKRSRIAERGLAHDGLELPERRQILGRAPGGEAGLRRDGRGDHPGDDCSDRPRRDADAAGRANAAGWTVGGLRNGTLYTFEVRAVSAAHNGAASEPASAMPGVATPPPPRSRVPGTCSGRQR